MAEKRIKLTGRLLGLAQEFKRMDGLAALHAEYADKSQLILWKEARAAHGDVSRFFYDTMECEVIVPEPKKRARKAAK